MQIYWKDLTDKECLACAANQNLIAYGKLCWTLLVEDTKGFFYSAILDWYTHIFLSGFFFLLKINAYPFLRAVESFLQLLFLCFILSYRADAMS